MTNHLLPKYLASESKHLRLLADEAAPVQWPGADSNHAAIVKTTDDEDPQRSRRFMDYWWMETTLCGLPVPQFDLVQYQAEARSGKPHTAPICAGDTDCPACLGALGL